MLGYSRETSESAESFSNTETEIINCINASKVFHKPAFVAIKLSGLASEAELRQLEKEIYLITDEGRLRGTSALSTAASQILCLFPELWGRLQRLSDAARKAEVHLVLDAELRFQGEVDALPSSAIICSILNRDGNNVWNTHQMYVLKLVLSDIRLFKDSFKKLSEWSGDNPIKLVRGAYLSQEPYPQVASSKTEVDENYDKAVTELLCNRTNPVIFATHNHRSILRAWQLLREGRVRAPPAANREINFAQLYGMGDHLTLAVLRCMKSTELQPNLRLAVIKYIPYGSLNEVMPYLARRAEENRGMLGGSILEREASYEELKRRLLRFLGIASIHYGNRE